MTRFLAFCFVVACGLPAVAVQDGQVMYSGGTVPGLNSGVVGHLDMASETSLIFEYPGSRQFPMPRLTHSNILRK
jgi:hypothetical protein